MLWNEQCTRMFRQQSQEFYAAGFQGLVKRWDKCLNLFGDYVENKCCLSLSPFVSFQSRFVTYLLTFPRTSTMTNKFVVIINSLKYQKLRKFHYMKWNFLYQITAASRTPDYRTTAPKSLFSLSSTEFVEPFTNRIPGYTTGYSSVSYQLVMWLH